MSAPRYFQLRHLHEATGIPERTLRYWSREGTIPAVQPEAGSRYLYSVDTLAWLEARGVTINHAALSQLSQLSEDAPDE